MAATYDNSVRVFSNANVTSLESASWTLTGSNLGVFSEVASGAGSAIAPNSVRIGGSGGAVLTQIGDQAVGLYGRHGVYRGTSAPSGSQTSYASWASNQDETLIISASYASVDSATPNRTLASATGGPNTQPSVSATSVAGEPVIDFVFYLDQNGGPVALTAGGSQTSRQEIDGADLGYEGMGLSSLTASGTSTAMSWTLASGSLNATDWSHYACSLIEATGGGGGTTRGNPFGNRGTAFNGGRTFHGIIQ